MAYLMNQQRRGKHTQAQFYLKKKSLSIPLKQIYIYIFIYIKGQCIPAHVLQNSTKIDKLTFIDKSAWQDSIALKYSVSQLLKQWGKPEITSTFIKHNCVWKEFLHHT